MKLQIKTRNLQKKLLVVALCAISHISMFAQNQKVTVNLQNVPLGTAMQAIGKQANVKISYSKEFVDTDKKVSIKSTNEKLDDVLKRLFKNLDVAYSYGDKSILLYRKSVNEKNTDASTDEKSDNLVDVSGTVVDSNNEPIIGATVSLVGTNTGVVTDIDGNFHIKAKKDSHIRISYIGCTEEYLTVKKKGHFDVVLKETSTDLEEVVVVGYGTQKKLNVTGAVTQISSKEIENRPVANMSQVLQGAIPNLNVTFSSGRPGESGSFNIRGNTSITGGSPLVLIDGIEGDINRINPRDVESVSVLKDASAAAVYGARAAYGVILVTTKTGQTGKVNVSYNGRYGFSKPTVSTDYETRGYYSALINDTFMKVYSGQPLTKYTEEDYEQMWLRRNDITENPERPWVVTDFRDGKETYIYYGNTDWYHHFFNDIRPNWEHSVNINGGTDKVKYLMSGNIYSQTGMFKISPDNYKSMNFRVKLSADILPWLNISNNTKYFYSKYFFPGRSSVDGTFTYMSLGGLASFVPRNPDGTLVYQSSLSQQALMGGEAAMLENDGHRNTGKKFDFMTDLGLTFKIHEKFNIKANYSYSHYNTQSVHRSVNIPWSQYPGEIEYLTTGRGLNKLTEQQINHWYHAVNAFGTYNDNYNDHNWTIMGGLNYETKYLKSLTMSREGLLSDDLDDFNLAKGDVMNITSSQNEYALLGFFYRLNYDYAGKYLFETSGRYDGSSRFGRGHRFGYFPSASAGWRFSEEEFFSPLRKVVSNGKVRFSYGALGNQQVGYYDYIQTIQTGGTMDYTFGDDILASYASVSDPNASNLTWETVISKNLGLDLGFFNQRLTASFDWYVRDTKDMLVKGRSLPGVYGAKEPKENAADLRTTGWELMVGWRDSFNLFDKPFNYSVNVGLSDYTSKITKFDNPTKLLTDYYVGQQLGEIWGYHVDGLFKTDEEARNYIVDQSAVNAIINACAGDEKGLRAGDLKYVDLDGNNKISIGSNTADDPGDRRVIGNEQPRYSYGINLGADWNGIDISLFFQGIGRQDWYPGTECTAFWGPYSRPYQTYIAKDFMDNVWSPENPDAYYPRPRGYVAMKTNRELGAVNDRYLQNLAYCRLKNLTIGYSFPEKWMKAIHIEGCRIYFSGENLLTWSKLKNDYLDPEQCAVGGSGTNGRLYPWSSTYSFGIDVNF